MGNKLIPWKEPCLLLPVALPYFARLCTIGPGGEKKEEEERFLGGGRRDGQSFHFPPPSASAAGKPCEQRLFNKLFRT